MTADIVSYAPTASVSRRSLSYAHDSPERLWKQQCCHLELFDDAEPFTGEQSRAGKGTCGDNAERERTSFVPRRKARRRAASLKQATENDAMTRKKITKKVDRRRQ
jgi:hypothetical protein